MDDFIKDYKAMFLSKLGLFTLSRTDNALIDESKLDLQLTETDMTIFLEI